VAFRLAPRINAAGRLYRADAGVELMLTADEGRAAAIAAELDGVNRERRDAERLVLSAAEQARAALPAELRLRLGAGARRGGLASGKWWGIVASRLAERPLRAGRPDRDRWRGQGQGSGEASQASICWPRWMPAGSTCCATGVTAQRPASRSEAGRLEDFRAAFVDHASRGARGARLVSAPR